MPLNADPPTSPDTLPRGGVDAIAHGIMQWIHLSMQLSAQHRAPQQADPGITFAQMRALELLMVDGASSVSQLTENLCMSTSAVSHLVQRLVDMGFVSRTEDESDRRQKNVALAHKGRVMIEHMMSERYADMRASVEHLSLPLRMRLHQLIDDIVAEMQGASGTALPAACPRRVLAGMDLSQRDLREEPLRGADLSGANLAHAVLDGVDLTRASLRGANLEHTSLVGCTLAHASFGGANLRHARLDHADCSDVSFAGANLTHANFAGANVTRANFQHAHLDHAHFSQMLGLDTARHLPVHKNKNSG